MSNGFVSALLVLAGGACAMAGYLFGAWHQRRAMEAELASDLFGDHSFDFLDEPPLRRAERPN
jgi:hypothetical protein